jgi:hypothetical protein
MNTKLVRKRSRKSAMVIMEVLVALGVFGLAALGLIKALAVAAQTAVVSQLELRMILRLQSTLTEYSKIARIEEGKWQSDPDELGVWTETEVVLLEDILNSEGQPLNEMYRIRVTGYYDNFGQTGEMAAETLRYARLYQATGAGGAGGAPAGGAGAAAAGGGGAAGGGRGPGGGGQGGGGQPRGGAPTR